VRPDSEADRLAVTFARVLRGAGLDVPVGSTITFADALAAVGLERRAGVYWAGRATLVRSPEDRDAYDRAFASFWEGIVEIPERSVPAGSISLAFDADRDTPDADEEASDDEQATPTVAVRWSPAEVLRHCDFAELTHAELVEARRMMADLKLAGPLRRSRRRQRTHRERGRPDLRRTVRRTLRTAGEPIDRAFTAPSQRPRRIVLLCDVSGSMEPYARAFLRFVQAAVVGHGRVEAFAMGTRLTRITRELSSRDPDAALSAASRRVLDWSGGTRLGEALRAFNDQWGVRGMARGAVVVILSDGWDRGDPDVLAGEMARLRRVAHRIVWVNPLKATPEYAPLARGMAAALPYVDEFVTGHSMAALGELAEVISK